MKKKEREDRIIQFVKKKLIKEAKREAGKLKKNARLILQKDLAEIGVDKVTLHSKKATIVNGALERYRQTIFEINQAYKKYLAEITKYIKEKKELNER